MPTMQQLEAALIKAHNAGDRRGAQAIADEIKRVRAAEPAPTAEAEMPWYQAALSGAERGIKPVAELVGRINPFQYAANAISEYIHPGNTAEMDRRMAAQARQAQTQHPNWFTGGQIAGEAVATAPFMTLAGAGVAGAGGSLARVAPRAGASLARVGKAIQTGGLSTGRTAAQTAALSKLARAGQMAERMAGGAISAAGGAALTGQDMISAAEFGAALPVIAKLVRASGGKLADITKLPRLRAAQIIRDSLGSNEDAARAAFAALSPNDQRLARQVLVDAGVEPRVFMGLGADVERLRPDEVGGILERQAAEREARLAQAAGGATATDRRAGAELARQNVSQATGPIRETAIERANVAGRVVPEAERIASAARQRADEITSSGFVSRMRGLEDRAAEQASIMGDMPAVFPDMGAIQKTRGISGAAGQRAEQATRAQIGLRQTARDMEDVVADLAAQGMRPLQVAPIVGQLRNMAAQPGTRADKLQRSTLTRLANELQGLADANGVINARDLYQIRKTGVNDIVDRLLGSRAQPASGTKERTASLLTSIRPMIDDAIETAGGTGWKDYLVRTRQGFEAVNRQELAATGAQLAKESPTEFTALMRGERPKIVEDIMGPGTKQYDIAGMALADPSKYLALKKSAQEIETLNRMTELGRQGGPAAAELIGRERPLLSRSLTRMGLAAFPPARISLEASEQALATTLAPRIQSQLAEGFLSGQNAAALMNQYPASLRMSETLGRLPPSVLNVLAQSANKAATGRYPQINPDNPEEVLLGVGEIDGQPYPMYGRPVRNRMATVGR